MKLFRYLLMASVVFLASACVSDEENIFDKSAAQRMNETVDKVTRILESSENGWEVQFYPNHDAQMGGVAMVAFFKDGKATIYNMEAGTVPVSSLYQVKGEQECLLTFDTYNAIFHYYSEPDGSSSPYGLESDYEFCYKSVSADENTIVFKGKRYSQPLILKRMDGSISAEDYIDQINELYDMMFSMPRSVAKVDGVEYEVNFANCLLSYKESETVIEDGEEVTKSVTYSYTSVPTLTGVHFQEPVTFHGVTFQDLVYNADLNEIATPDGKVTFPFQAPKGFKEYEELAGNYTFIDADGDTYNPVVKCNNDGETYTITGMNYSNTKVTAYYNKTYGSLEIRPQYTGTWSAYYVWTLCTTSTGSATWATSASIIGRNSDNGDITFDGNPAYTGIIEYACSAQQISGDNVLGYLTKYDEPLKFTKK